MHCLSIFIQTLHLSALVFAPSGRTPQIAESPYYAVLYSQWAVSPNGLHIACRVVFLGKSTQEDDPVPREDYVFLITFNERAEKTIVKLPHTGTRKDSHLDSSPRISWSQDSRYVLYPCEHTSSTGDVEYRMCRYDLVDHGSLVVPQPVNRFDLALLSPDGSFVAIIVNDRSNNVSTRPAVVWRMDRMTRTDLDAGASYLSPALKRYSRAFYQFGDVLWAGSDSLLLTENNLRVAGDAFRVKSVAKQYRVAYGADGDVKADCTATYDIWEHQHAGTESAADVDDYYRSKSGITLLSRTLDDKGVANAVCVLDNTLHSIDTIAHRMHPVTRIVPAEDDIVTASLRKGIQVIWGHEGRDRCLRLYDIRSARYLEQKLIKPVPLDVQWGTSCLYFRGRVDVSKAPQTHSWDRMGIYRYSLSDNASKLLVSSKELLEARGSIPADERK